MQGQTYNDQLQWAEAWGIIYQFEEIYVVVKGLQPLLQSSPTGGPNNAPIFAGLVPIRLSHLDFSRLRQSREMVNMSIAIVENPQRVYIILVITYRHYFNWK